MRHARPRHRGAFTLVEMLVVLGIIVLLVGILIPAVMRARRQARLTACMSNFRQIGALYLLYAERNEDYIPLGTSRFKDPNHPGVVHYTPLRPPPHNTPYPWPGYHTLNNQYLWVEGSPSAAMGPFLLAGLINTDNAKMLYCPSEAITWFRWEYNRADFDKVKNGDTSASIRIGYSVRPIKRLWTHDHLNHTVEYPELMPKLMKNDRRALVSEHVQITPFTHGTENDPMLNVAYADGSVRTVSGKAIQPGLKQYVTIDQATGNPPGYSTASNNYAAAEQPGDIWSLLDQN